jgi:hypothetical protein
MLSNLQVLASKYSCFLSYLGAFIEEGFRARVQSLWSKGWELHF